jgi:hypothetical protein
MTVVPLEDSATLLHALSVAWLKREDLQLQHSYVAVV